MSIPPITADMFKDLGPQTCISTTLVQARVAGHVPQATAETIMSFTKNPMGKNGEVTLADGQVAAKDAVSGGIKTMDEKGMDATHTMLSSVTAPDNSRGWLR